EVLRPGGRAAGGPWDDVASAGTCQPADRLKNIGPKGEEGEGYSIRTIEPDHRTQHRTWSSCKVRGFHRVKGCQKKSEGTVILVCVFILCALFESLNHDRRLQAVMAAPAVSMSSTVSVADKGMALPGAGSAASMSGTASLDHGTAVPGPGASLNMLRRAKDVVSATDVPFLLMTPHASSDVIRDMMTECYGLVGRSYDTREELHEAGQLLRLVARPAGVDVSQHGAYYQEGTALLTLRHKGRVIIMLWHPSAVAESMYLSRPGTKRGDLAGLVEHVNSTDYYDNWMTRMLANVPPNGAVTEEHFRTARMILENKFIIGLVDDIKETVQRRSLYFGWKDVLSKDGCELQHVQRRWQRQ
ncbi:hypothetical protein ACHAWF_008107, partial [Thalassiosira exigua]